MYTLNITGGLERMTVSLANELAKRGYNISIITLDFFEKSYFEIDRSIKIFTLQQHERDKSLEFKGGRLSRMKTHYTLFSRLNKIIRQNRIEVLIASGILTSTLWLPVKIWNKKLKVILWEHLNATMQGDRYVKARQIAKKHADAIVVLTEQNKELYMEESDSKLPIFVRNNFMDKYPAEKAALKSKNVLAVGRYDTQKGFDILIDIWGEVKKNPASNGWILKIVGDGEEKEKIKKLIAEKELEESVNLIDATPNVAQYYLDASMYVMTSRYEGLPVVLIEAQSYGLPIVSFDCMTGPREVITKGEDGFLIPMDDKKEMAQKMIELMSDEELRISMGKKAKENSQRFKKELIIEQWEELIEEL